MNKTIKSTAPVTFTGKGKVARETAFAAIAPLSYAADTSRIIGIANMRVVLGASPSEIEVITAKAQWIIGRVASRLPTSKVPLVDTQEQRMVRATDLVQHYAKPVADGAKVHKLRAGKKGYRTLIEQRIVRAAEEACSVFFAELNLSNAKTSTERKADVKKRAATVPGAGKGKIAPPAHSALVTPAKALTSAEYVNHMQTQLASLLAFDDKNAKLRPVTHMAFAEGLRALKQLANKAANDFAEREAIADAKRK